MSICPECKATLTPGVLDGVQFEECTKCLGTWILEASLKALEKDGTQELQRLDTMEGSFQSTGTVSAVGACPACSQPMEEFHFMMDTPIVLHRCNSCEGLWIEHGELTQMAKAIADAHRPPTAEESALAAEGRAQVVAVEKEADKEARQIAMRGLLGFLPQYRS